jgi:hypothetical protein
MDTTGIVLQRLPSEHPLPVIERYALFVLVVHAQTVEGNGSLNLDR